MVVSEGINGGDSAYEEAEEDVKTVVPEIKPSRGGDEDGDAERYEGDDKEVDRGRSSLATQRLDLGVSSRNHFAVKGRGSRRVVVWKAPSPGWLIRIDLRAYAGREGSVGGAISRDQGWNDEGNGDGKLSKE